MTAMTASLPNSLRRCHAHRVENGGYGSASECVRELIHQDRARRAEQSAAFWAERRARLGR
jgi:Arc/MetJ-type ribon-helix-helix transcriptional regulator